MDSASGEVITASAPLVLFNPSITQPSPGQPSRKGAAAARDATPVRLHRRCSAHRAGEPHLPRAPESPSGLRSAEEARPFLTNILQTTDGASDCTSPGATLACLCAKRKSGRTTAQRQEAQVSPTWFSYKEARAERANLDSAVRTGCACVCLWVCVICSVRGVKALDHDALLKRFSSKTQSFARVRHVNRHMNKIIQ